MASGSYPLVWVFQFGISVMQFEESIHVLGTCTNNPAYVYVYMQAGR